MVHSTEYSIYFMFRAIFSQIPLQKDGGRGKHATNINAKLYQSENAHGIDIKYN